MYSAGLDSNISFTGLKSNLKLGEKVLREVRKEFPKRRSDSFIRVKIEQCRRPKKLEKLMPKFEEIAEKLEKIAKKYCMYTDEVTREKGGDYFSYSGFINKLKQIIIKYRGAANCDEFADIVQYNLLCRNEKPHNIAMWIKNAKTGENKKWGAHLFTVFGLKKGAKFDEPKTWGNKAVVVDAWGNIVMQAREAIEHFKTMLDFNPEKHKIVYTVQDRMVIK